MYRVKVDLVSYTINPQDKIEQAASNCYDSVPNGKLMKACYKSGHHSVLEFAQFHFHIEGISRCCSFQLVRHRTASYAQRSQRFCSEDGFQIITPPTILTNHIAKAAYDRFMHSAQAVYDELQRAGIPNEDARFVLPNACSTVIDMSIDLRNLIHFMNERLCTRAQWEIRQLAQEMRKRVVEVFPEAATMLVPKCEAHEVHFCTENKSCGRHAHITELIRREEDDGE